MGATRKQVRSARHYERNHCGDVLRKFAEAEKYLKSQSERRERVLREASRNADVRF